MEESLWNKLKQEIKGLTYYKKLKDEIYEVVNFSRGIEQYGLLLDYIIEMDSKEIRQLKEISKYETIEDVIYFITSNEIFDYMGHPYNVENQKELVELLSLRGIDLYELA